MAQNLIPKSDTSARFAGRSALRRYAIVPNCFVISKESSTDVIGTVSQSQYCRYYPVDDALLLGHETLFWFANLFAR